MFRILETGFFTTVQDSGRYGFRDIGIPLSGCMDARAARLVNSLLENDQSDAVLEITMTGPKIQFEEPTFIALGGAEMSAELNGQAIGIYEVHPVNTGDLLTFGKLQTGFRTYLGLKGGIRSTKVLNSRSFFKSITKVDRIKENEEFAYQPCVDYKAKITQIKPESFCKEQKLIVEPGPEFELLDIKDQEKLFHKNFTIAKEYNRMAYQLEETLNEHTISMITSANLPGTVQLTPAGKLIVLMRDGQTTGGYPRVLQLNEASISVLSQKKFGDKISFVRS